MSQRIPLTLLSWEHLPYYLDRQPLTIHQHIARLQRIEPALDEVSFVVASAIFSSQIEGSGIDLHD